MRDLTLAEKEANSLAMHLAKTCYPEVKNFGLCDSLPGVISQIDNMVMGCIERTEILENHLKRLGRMETFVNPNSPAVTITNYLELVARMNYAREALKKD